MIIVEVKKLHPNAIIPEYQTAGSAAIDLHVLLDHDYPVMIQPGKVMMVGTGLAINMPSPDMAAMILPRSGLGAKNGIVLGNLVGLIDSDYNQELKLAVWNRSDEPFCIRSGDRLAQLVFVPVLRVGLWHVGNFTSESDRGGFGSTGV